MRKGHKGESCAEAIKACVAPAEVVGFSELCTRIKVRGPWTESTIWQQLMSAVVNLPPARHHWPSDVPFLFLRPDGQYELYDPAKHPRVIE